MANLKITGMDELVMKLSDIADHAPDIAKKALYAGAGIIADQAKKNLQGVLSDKATGQLEESLGIAPIKQDEDGNLNTRIGFDGYDRKGTANQLKARVLESGSSKQKKRPFMRTAANAKKPEAEKKMEEIFLDEIQKKMN